jgi:CheY-like chemotaxis protein
MSAIVLNVEDNRDDVLLLQRACRKAQAGFNLQFVEDGEFALEYLLGRGAYADRIKHPLPDFILLDLNMPRKSGFEVLEWLKANADFRNIPVAIFSSSANSEDIRKAISRGANCYLAKPLDYGSLVKLIANLDAALRQEVNSVASTLAQLPECCAVGQEIKS